MRDFVAGLIAVGYRVRSERGTQFRRWATERLEEYLVRGFAMNDQRLKNPPVDGSGVRVAEDPNSGEFGYMRRLWPCSELELDVPAGSATLK
jgi:hypothetical protein